MKIFTNWGMVVMSKRKKWIIIFVVAIAFLLALSHVVNKDDAMAEGKEGQQVESPVQGVITTPEETGCDIDPEDQVSSDEIIYAAMMIDFLDRGSDIIMKFVEQNQELANDSILMFDQNWTAKTAMVIVEMQNWIKEGRCIKNVPERFQPSHDCILKALDKYEFVAVNYPMSIDNLDAELLMQCFEATGRAEQLINEGQALMPEM